MDSSFPEPGSSTSISNESIPIFKARGYLLTALILHTLSPRGEVQVTYFKLFLASQPQCKNICEFRRGEIKVAPALPRIINLPRFSLMAQLTQTTIPPYIVMNTNVSLCCNSYCGVLLPFVANGSYNNPRGGGKTLVTFRLAGFPTCGIPVARVLRGDLEGLNERDALAELNPNSGSMRLRIEVSNPSPVRSSLV